jgi:hypothetical protein
MHDFDIAEDDDAVPFERYTDPLSGALGARGYMDRHLIAECEQEFGEGVRHAPERFDRFYWEPEPLLVDILADGTPDMLERDRERKHIDFKRIWCAENDMLYMVISESDAMNAMRVREILADLKNPRVAVPLEVSSPTPVPRRRGRVQRPKATA